MATKPDVVKVVDGRLVVDVELTNGVPSASGKTVVFYTTHGSVQIGEGYTVGINLYRSRKAAP